MTQVNKYDAVITSPLGKIGITLDREHLAALHYLADDTPLLNPRDAASMQVITQLEDFFCGEQRDFSVNIQLAGTQFQNQVWQALRQIPHGQTRTYGELAHSLNTSPRAIGQACRSNPIPIVVPCHRVTAVNHPGGYAGAVEGKLMDIKTWLLQHEKSHS